MVLKANRMAIKHKLPSNNFKFKVQETTFRLKDSNTIINQVKGFDTTIIES